MFVRRKVYKEFVKYTHNTEVIFVLRKVYKELQVHTFNVASMLLHKVLEKYKGN